MRAPFMRDPATASCPLSPGQLAAAAATCGPLPCKAATCLPLSALGALETPLWALLVCRAAAPAGQLPQLQQERARPGGGATEISPRRRSSSGTAVRLTGTGTGSPARLLHTFCSSSTAGASLLQDMQANRISRRSHAAATAAQPQQPGPGVGRPRCAPQQRTERERRPGEAQAAPQEEEEEQG